MKGQECAAADILDSLRKGEDYEYRDSALQVLEAEVKQASQQQQH